MKCDMYMPAGDGLRLSNCIGPREDDPHYWATGDRVCRFRAGIQQSGKGK